MLKAKHAHGSRKNLESAIANKIVDNFDVLFLSGEDENPAMGWLDKNGNPIILSPADEVAKLETQVETELAKKANASEVETALASKADAEKVETLETELATKVTAEEVETAVKAEIEATVEKTKYEVADVPVGTLVDYRDSEIRICCPENTVFTKQNVGAGGDSNSYYMTFKTFAPSDDAVGYIEHLNGQADEQILTSFNVDANGRRYQPTWLALAKYDEAAGVWSYWGAKSEKNHYIGYDYQIDWFNADGVMIASDNVRINLSNENCHFEIEPYYVGTMKQEIETMVEEKIAEVKVGNEIIEF